MDGWVNSRRTGRSVLARPLFLDLQLVVALVKVELEILGSIEFLPLGIHVEAGLGEVRVRRCGGRFLSSDSAS